MIVIVLSVFWWLVALFILVRRRNCIISQEGCILLVISHGNKLKVQMSWWKGRYSVACCSPVLKLIILISYDSYLPRAFAEFLFNRYADRYACMSKLQWTQKLLAWAISSFVKRVHVWPLLKRLKMSIVPRLQGEHKVPGQLKQK